MRDACTADDPWQGYRQKFRVFFREAKEAADLTFKDDHFDKSFALYVGPRDAVKAVAAQYAQQHKTYIAQLRELDSQTARLVGILAQTRVRLDALQCLGSMRDIRTLEAQ